MHITQARAIQQKLATLEGIITKEAREYVWKVLVAPSGTKKIKRFAAAIDPATCLSFEAPLRSYRSGELSVYFFLKKNGSLFYMEYQEFLTSRSVDITLHDLRDRSIKNARLNKAGKIS